MLARGLPPVMIILLYSVPTVRSLALWLKSMCSSYAKKLLTWRERFFEIEGLEVTFKFEEVPNDMKMLAMLGGEL